jgi:hypothetical protein
MTWRQRRNQSRWREFEFMLHQVRRAVDPRLPFQKVMEQWPKICRRLAEAPRKRRSRNFLPILESIQTS